MAKILMAMAAMFAVSTAHAFGSDCGNTYYSSVSYENPRAYFNECSGFHYGSRVWGPCHSGEVGHDYGYNNVDTSVTYYQAPAWGYGGSCDDFRYGSGAWWDCMNSRGP